jgi:serine/threonine protein kinase
MGEVFRAFDQHSGEVVCLKRLHPHIRPGVLHQELLALRRLSHPNIIALLDFSLESPTSLITQFVDGPDLESWRSRHSAIPEFLAADIVQQVLDGLAFAHAREIIHCDLKPANVMIELEGARLKPRILDFGIAIVDRLDDECRITGEGRVAGTVEYMAPEQFRGEVLTPACDVYAAGLMLATLVTGVSPFSGQSMETTIGQKLSAQSGLRLSATHPTIADVVESCTQPNPDSRPPALAAAASLYRLTSTLRHPMRPINLAFRRGLVGWDNGIGKVNGVSPNYPARVTPRTGSNGDGPAGVTLESLGDTPHEFGVLMQSFPADRLAGKRLRLEADVTTRAVSGRAALWLRVDSNDGQLAFDNMAGSPITGTTANQRVSLDIAVPLGATAIHFGLLLAGAGSMTSGPLRLTLDAGQARPDLALI